MITEPLYMAWVLTHSALNNDMKVAVKLKASSLLCTRKHPVTS